MRILWTAPQYAPVNSGYSNASSPLSRAVAAHPSVEAVQVLTPMSEGLSDRETIGGVDIYRFERIQARGLVYRSWPLLRRPLLLGYWWRVMRPVIRNFRPDVVFSDTAELGYLNVAIAARSPLPQVLRVHAATETEHVYEPHRPPGPYERFVAGVVDDALHAVTEIASTNRYHVSYVQRLAYRNDDRVMAQHRFHVIPNALPWVERVPDNTLRKRYGIPPSDVLVVQLGRMDEDGLRQKGFEDSLAALGRQQVDGARAIHLLLIGDGPCRNRLEQLTSRIGIARAVTFAGSLSNMEVRRVLDSADVFLAPSRYEGMSMVALEAVRAGLPMVASATGGLLDLVVDDVTGRLIPPRDPDAIAAALTELASNPETRTRMRQAAQRVFLERFEVSHVADMVVSTLRDVLSGDQTSTREGPGT